MVLILQSAVNEVILPLLTPGRWRSRSHLLPISYTMATSVRRIRVSVKNVKLSRSEVVVGSAPVPGQYIEGILSQVLNDNPEQITKLEARGAIYRGEVAA